MRTIEECASFDQFGEPETVYKVYSNIDDKKYLDAIFTDRTEAEIYIYEQDCLTEIAM